MSLLSATILLAAFASAPSPQTPEAAAPTAAQPVPESAMAPPPGVGVPSGATHAQSAMP
jgi:hypothetical protein